MADKKRKRPRAPSIGAELREKKRFRDRQRGRSKGVFGSGFSGIGKRPPRSK